MGSKVLNRLICPNLIDLVEQFTLAGLNPKPYKNLLIQIHLPVQNPCAAVAGPLWTLNSSKEIGIEL